MRSHAFTLLVPADAGYRALAPEVGKRYVELLGGTKAEGAAFASALAEAIDALVDGPKGAAGGPGSVDVPVELVFSPGAAGVEVTVRVAGRSSVVRHRLPASQS